MFQNYIKSAIRSLTKNKMYTIINVLGLTVGMTCFILIALYVQYELSYDQQHEKADQVYRIAQQQKGNDFRGTDEYAVTPLPLTSALMEEFPEVIAATSLQLGIDLLSKEDKVFFESGLFADEFAFDVFTIPVLEGEGKTALKDPNSIILTKSLAEKYFNDASPIGETILFRNERPLTVKGVIEDVPKNQHFTYDYIVALQNSGDYSNDVKNVEGGWISNNYRGYVRLAEGSDYKELEKNIYSAFNDKIEAAFNYIKITYNATFYFNARYFLQPIQDIHLHSDINFELGRNSDMRYVYLFTSIAFLILLLAAINYMNLATARSARRSKEIGMRKVLGAKKGQLINQLLGESFFLTLISFLLSIGLTSLLLPAFNQLVDLEIPFSIVGNQWIFIGMLVTALAIGGLSGLYPAVVLSSINPVKAFKGNFLKNYKEGLSLRNMLVVGQFVAAIVLGTGGMIIYGQLQYIQSKKLGYNRDQIAYIFYAQPEVNEKAATIRSEFLRHPSIEEVAFTRTLPLNTNNQGVVDTWEGNAKERTMHTYRFYVDHNFIDLFEIELVEGRNFSPEIPTDSSATYILNESAVKAIGWESAVGKQFRDGKVIGVVKDFHFQPFDLAIEPLFMTFISDSNRSRFGNIAMKIRMDDLDNTVAHIQNTMKTLIPQFPFEVQFMDEAYNDIYQAEQRFGKAFNIFTLLALFIACMGLFGLISHQVLQRTKEIGIRKVLGASVSNIVTLLSKDFLKLIIIAFVIAIPISYYFMQQWLEDFAYRIEISWWIFVLTGATAIGIALLTVSFQSVKAAIANPIESLRNE